MKTQHQCVRQRILWLGLLVAALLIMASVKEVRAQQWSTASNGNDIYKTNASGNVGIGTTGPAGALHVYSTGNTSHAVNIDAQGTGNAQQATINLITLGDGAKTVLSAGTKGWHFTARGDAFSNSAEQNDLQLYSWNGTSTITNFQTWDYATGNVGIGTSRPLGKFHIVTPGYADTSIPAWDNHFFLVGADSNAGAIALAYNQTTNTGYLMSLSPGVAWRNTVINPFAGNVGIGTTTPDTRLTIVGSGTTIPTTYNNGDVLTLITPNDNFNAFSIAKGGVANPQGILIGINQASLYSEIQAAHMGVATDDLILNRQGGNVGIGIAPGSQYKLDVAGNINSTATITGNNINAKYQDVAEWVESSQTLPAGTVVVLDHTKSNQVVASSAGYDTRVAGVISAQPGIVLGESGDNKVLVATTGRVRVKVDATKGPIQIGDLLVTSDVPGVAMKSEPIKVGGRPMHMPGTLIGKALEPLAKGSGQILVLLSLQ